VRNSSSTLDVYDEGAAGSPDAFRKEAWMAKLGKGGIARRLLQRYPKSRAEPLCQFLAARPLHSFAHCRKAA
jgi:hypothetical protein